MWMTTSEVLAHTELPLFLKENIKLAEKILQDNMQVKY